MQKVTLKDIANRTGYTINTVSRALKNKNDISLETRKRICQVADEMGYIRNSVAGSLRTGLTLSIGIIAANVSNPFFAIFSREIEKRAYDYGYNVIIFNTYGEADTELKRVKDALSKHVDGIVISPCEMESKSLAYLREAGIPFVVIGRTHGDEDVNYVTADDEKGGFLATRHLIRHGHQKILHLSGPRDVPSTIYRLNGYRKALKEANMPYDPRYVIEVGLGCGQCRQVIHQLAENHFPFDAIFAFNDIIAAEAVYAAYERGLKVPEDFSLVGFDNIQKDILMSIPLDSISTSAESIGEKSVDILMDNIKHREHWDVCQETLNVELVTRGSVI